MPEEPEPKKTNAELAEKDSRFKEVLLPRLTLILSSVAILVSLFAAFSKGPQGVREVYDYVGEHLSLIIIYSNIGVSIVAFVMLVRQRDVRLILQDKEKFKSLAELGDDVNIDIYTSNLNNRVEKLVNQFQLHVSLFAFSLILVYIIIALTRGESRQISYFTVTTNLANLLGALFVHCGFIVLYNKTLVAESISSREAARDANEQFRLETTQNIHYYSNRYWAMPMLIVVPYVLILITLSVSNVSQRHGEQVIFLNLADLFAGSYNGLAMSLLFGRYVSIEQLMRGTDLYSNLFKNIFYPFSNASYKSFVTVGIVFILPIYALAQPLFGTLEFTQFGEPKTFQMWVFGICLVGKICFFHLTYILIGKKILHLYIYGLASSVGNFRELESCFNPEARRGAQG